MGVRATAALLGILLACAGGQAREAGRLAPGDHQRSLTHAGRERSYVLHVPPRAESQPLPLVLAFHGGGGNAKGFQRYARLDPLADRDAFLVAYPNGISRWFEGRLLTWNAGDCCGFAADEDADDVGFALAVIDDVARLSALDRTRVYATGHSNGAMLSYRLGAEAADRIAAIAPVAAAAAFDGLPGRPLPVLHIQSVDDPRALYAGGVRESFGREVRHRSAEAELARWRARAACPTEPVILETHSRPVDARGPHTATLLVWGPCAEGAEVRLWKLGGAGHGWPGSDPVLPERVMGPRTDVIDAAEEIWRFLRRFHSP